MLDRTRDKDVERNRALFPPGSETSDDSVDEDGPEVNVHPDIFNFVNPLEIDELQSELKKRNLSARGEEVELKVRLANHLQEELEKSGSDSD